MSSEESPKERKPTMNETGRKTEEIDPKDIELIRKNVLSNNKERRNPRSD